MPEQQGKVYLVGAGPGDAIYLTVQAQHLLAQAEVVVYDALVDAQLLQLVPESCLHIDVGKRGGRASPDQASIDRLLVEHCQNGKRVVRLKSGDPFIFGRCRSEIQALKAAGCEFEVIPGLSSALAVPLLAGIALTDPELSQGFAVLSAHDPTTLDWQTLARLETLVILMGGRRLPEIVAQLQHHGRSPLTPIAIIRWGGHADQQIWHGSLQSITQQTTGTTLSPAVVVIGAVAQLQLQGEVPPRPLTGKTILVTRAAGSATAFGSLLQQAGAKVIEMPALEIGPPSSWSALDQAIAQLKTFNWLILTSTNGVEAFFERLHNQGQDARSLAGLQIAVVGKKTALSLRQQGLNPDFIPPDFVADSLVAHFPDSTNLAKTKILFPRVETGGRDTLVAELAAQGAEVVEVPAYESRCPATLSPVALEVLQNHAVDVVTFASSKTVRNFCQLLEQAASSLNDPEVEPANPEWRTWLEKVRVASIGPQTSKACKALLGRVDIEAAEYTLEGLTQAIIDYYSP